MKWQIVITLSVVLLVFLCAVSVFSQITWQPHDIASVDDPQDMVIADINGDGLKDLVVAVYNDGVILWFENNGDFKYNQHTVATGVVEAYSVDATDIDQDGDTDVVCGSGDFNGGIITWWQNDGTGLVWTEHLIGQSWSVCVNACDMEPDGDIDIIVSRYLWWENDGDENFTANYIEPEGDICGWGDDVHPVDIDGDGDLDVLGTFFFCGEHPIWHEFRGTGFLDIHLIEIYGFWTQINCICDWNPDGDTDIDLLVTEFDGPAKKGGIRWFENTGDRWKEHTIDMDMGYIDWLCPYDIDSDGDDDVVVTSSKENYVHWYENLDGLGASWELHPIDTSINGARWVCVDDVDGDGSPDIYCNGGIYDNGSGGDIIRVYKKLNTQ